jgi:hypothetical protein
VGAEAGLPALIVFCGLIASSFRSSWRLSKVPHTNPDLRTISNLGFTLTAAVSMFAICGIFNTDAYSFQLPVLASLTAALERIAKPYLDAPAAVSQSSQSVPVGFVNRKLAQRRQFPLET